MLFRACINHLSQRNLALEGTFPSSPPRGGDKTSVLGALEKDRLGLLECRSSLNRQVDIPRTSGNREAVETFVVSAGDVDQRRALLLDHQLERFRSLRDSVVQARLALEGPILRGVKIDRKIAGPWDAYFAARTEFNQFASGIYGAAQLASLELPNLDKFDSTYIVHSAVLGISLASFS